MKETANFYLLLCLHYRINEWINSRFFSYSPLHPDANPCCSYLFAWSNAPTMLLLNIKLRQFHITSSVNSFFLLSCFQSGGCLRATEISGLLNSLSGGGLVSHRCKMLTNISCSKSSWKIDEKNINVLFCDMCYIFSICFCWFLLWVAYALFNVSVLYRLP